MIIKIKLENNNSNNKEKVNYIQRSLSSSMLNTDV